MKHDVIVIGGGLGGLECGYILARAGKSVLVLEQGRQIGGCLQSYRRDGLEFDTGFHYVGGLDEGQPLHRIFCYLGLDSLPWLRMDEEFDRILIGGHEYALTQGYEHFADRLADDFPKEREALKRYASLLRETEEHQLEMLDPSKLKEDSESVFLSSETNAWKYLHELFGDSSLIDAVSGASVKLELRKETLPLFTFLHGNSGYVGSSWRLRGSGSMLTDTLAKGIRAQGGEVICRAEVKELVEEEGRIVRAVCADGNEYEGDSFICDIHPQAACGLVKRSKWMKPSYRKRIAGQANTCGTFTVSLVLRPDTFSYFNHNYYVYRHPDVWRSSQTGEIDRVMVCCKAPEDGSGYIRQVDLLAPMPWEQCMPWMQTRVGKRGDEYEVWKENLANECMALAETVVPGLNDGVEQRYISTPLTYTDYLHTPEGSSYGIRKDFRAPLGGILSPRTSIPNLYLTGQSLIMHGVQGVTQTALFTCAWILGRDWIWRHIVEGKQ